MKKRSTKLILKKETILKLSNFKFKGGVTVETGHQDPGFTESSAVICCA